ncbi:MAG: thiolase domain-containing protein [Candidatus Levybacteria bacterium]|nr:thiolase domain-containing protein [Candidatus Levybacteria bacterium]
MNIGVLGTYVTKFGELWGVSLEDLLRESAFGAIEKSGLKPSHVDAIYTGNMLSGALGGQENVGSFVANALSLFVPSVRVEAACASGGIAVHTAIQSLLSGTHKTVLVIGAEKMTDHLQDEVSTTLTGAGGEHERQSGATFAGLYALLARSYMDTFHVSSKELAGVSVKNHFHGTKNPNAQFRYLLTADDVLKSTKIADPLHLLDCSPISDGAAAIILTTDENLLKMQKKVVSIIASEVATDSLEITQRSSLVSLPVTIHAAQNAYKKTGLTVSDIAVAEVHDCFSIAEVLAVEDLGFSKKGKGAADISKKKYTLGVGKQIINPSGGLKACGHPVGATGVKQIVEITTQLRGEAGDRQVVDAKIGLAQNVAGSGSTAVIHILKRL